MTMKVKSSKGFTLIELVVVIVILGILAATALPRFINLNRDAEQASFDSFVGAFRTGINLYHVRWQTQGQPDQAFVGFNSTPSPQGYPVGGADLTQIGEGDCRTIWQDVLADVDSPTFIRSTSGWGSSIQAVDWSSNASQIGSFGETSDIFCHYVYTRAFNNGAFSGLAGERVPAIQYNTRTGEVNAITWPFNP